MGVCVTMKSIGADLALLVNSSIVTVGIVAHKMSGNCISFQNSVQVLQQILGFLSFRKDRGKKERSG